MSLDEVRARLDAALVALDFDGTLAPIVARPQDARPAPGTVETLTALARRVRRLAVVTGRPAATAVELGGLAAIPGLVVVGHYGLERWAAGELTSPPVAPGIALVRRDLPPLPDGATVEDKSHSIVVHTRRTADPAGDLAALEAPLGALAARAELELVGGRYVWELRPPGIDKGAALRSLAIDAHPGAVLVAGDDLGDLPLFEAAAGLGVPAARVAVLGADADPRVAAAADLTVEGPAALLSLLAGLVSSQS
ncbi:MAG TPA: trehalose-phosphatase [Mycobacteriales bacterium]